MGTEIKTGKVVEPKIYAYTTPQVTTNDGWIKIGYTERDVETRIREQTHTAAIQTEILWNYLAEYVDGPEKGLNFKDHDFHGFLKFHDIERRPKTEWFYFNGTPEKSEGLFNKFIHHDVSGYQPGKVMNTHYVRSKTKRLQKHWLISIVMKIVNSYGMQNLGLAKHYQPMI